MSEGSHDLVDHHAIKEGNDFLFIADQNDLQDSVSYSMQKAFNSLNRANLIEAKKHAKPSAFLDTTTKSNGHQNSLNSADGNAPGFFGAAAKSIEFKKNGGIQVNTGFIDTTESPIKTVFATTTDDHEDADHASGLEHTGEDQDSGLAALKAQVEPLKPVIKATTAAVDGAANVVDVADVTGGDNISGADNIDATADAPEIVEDGPIMSAIHNVSDPILHNPIVNKALHNPFVDTMLHNGLTETIAKSFSSTFLNTNNLAATGSMGLLGGASMGSLSSLSQNIESQMRAQKAAEEAKKSSGGMSKDTTVKVGGGKEAVVATDGNAAEERDRARIPTKEENENASLLKQMQKMGISNPELSKEILEYKNPISKDAPIAARNAFAAPTGMRMPSTGMTQQQQKEMLIQQRQIQVLQRQQMLQEQSQELVKELYKQKDPLAQIPGALPDYSKLNPQAKSWMTKWGYTEVKAKELIAKHNELVQKFNAMHGDDPAAQQAGGGGLLSKIMGGASVPQGGPGGGPMSAGGVPAGAAAGHLAHHKIGFGLHDVFYFAKTGFLLFGGLCSKMFGMGLIGYLAFQSLNSPRTNLPALLPPFPPAYNIPYYMVPGSQPLSAANLKPVGFNLKYRQIPGAKNVPILRVNGKEVPILINEDVQKREQDKKAAEQLEKEKKNEEKIKADKEKNMNITDMTTDTKMMKENMNMMKEPSKVEPQEPFVKVLTNTLVHESIYELKKGDNNSLFNSQVKETVQEPEQESMGTAEEASPAPENTVEKTVVNSVENSVENPLENCKASSEIPLSPEILQTPAHVWSAEAVENVENGVSVVTQEECLGEDQQITFVEKTKSQRTSNNILNNNEEVEAGRDDLCAGVEPRESSIDESPESSVEVAAPAIDLETATKHDKDISEIVSVPEISEESIADAVVLEKESESAANESSDALEESPRQISEIPEKDSSEEQISEGNIIQDEKEEIEKEEVIAEETEKKFVENYEGKFDDTGAQILDTEYSPHAIYTQNDNYNLSVLHQSCESPTTKEEAPLVAVSMEKY